MAGFLIARALGPVVERETRLDALEKSVLMQNMVPKTIPGGEMWTVLAKREPSS
jgi:hypothetical protein